MNLVIIAALVAVCSAAKLDRTYLPPASAKTAGGSPGSLQTPFAGNTFNQGLGGLPKGSFTNQFQGVVVDAAAAGTRASESETGLGAPRPTYGSTDSKVGDAAFRGNAGFRQVETQPTDEDISIDSADSDVQAANAQVSGFAQSNNGRFESKPERSQAAYERIANTLRFENEVGQESYHFAFETDNGISAEENGVATNGVQAQGGFSYTGDDGQVYSVTYVADEGGYQPKGDHLPTPPPIPEEILRALERNAQDEAAGVIDDGSYDAQRYNTGADYTENNENAEQNRSPSQFASNRSPPRFGNRQEVDATASGSFISQENQPLGNSNDAFGHEDDSTTVDSGSNNFDNRFAQPSPSSRLPDNRFGSKKEYLPPTQKGFNSNGNNQAATSFGFNTVEPSSETPQNTPPQRQTVFTGNNQPQTKPGSFQQFSRPKFNRLNAFPQSSNSVNTENRYDPTPSNASPTDEQVIKTQENVFASRNEYLPPTRGNRPQKPTSFVNPSQGLSSESQRFDASQSASVSAPSRLSQGFSPSQNTVQMPQQFNKFQQPASPSFSQNNKPSFSTLNSQRPTSQPSTELTTPLEPSEQSNTETEYSLSTVASQNSDAQPISQFGNYNTQDFTRPQPTAAQPENLSTSLPTQIQNRFQSASNGNERPESFQGGLAQNQPDDAQYSPSTIRPNYNQQPQAPDHSYYYRQPAKPFNTPTSPNSGIPSAPTQFNRVPQKPTSNSQFIGTPQKNFPINPFQSQRGQSQGTTRYPQPPTVAPTSQTTSFKGQYQENSLATQYNGITQASISPFRPQYQPTTRYPRPPIVSPTRPTSPSKSQFSQNTEITQATASVFGQPTAASNVNSVAQSNFGARPAYQQMQFINQASVMSQAQPEPTSTNDQDQNSQSVPTQQYSGEIYEYNKPADRLPKPTNAEPTATNQREQNRSQFGSTQNGQLEQSFASQQPTRPSLDTRFGSQPNRSQFTAQNSVPTDQPTSETKPQFNAQPQQFSGSQQQGNQAYRPQFGAQNKPNKCCQSLNAQISQLEAQKQAQSNRGVLSNRFGDQFSGPQSQSSAQSVAGRGEVFGGPRKPPSFDQETGYHY